MSPRSESQQSRNSRRAKRREALRLWVRRVGIGAAVAGALWFLVEGGEWGTYDLWRQSSRFEELQASVRQLEREVDSLRAEHKAVTTDPVRLERVARERYGMIRPGELLYRFEDDAPADAGAGKRR